MDLSSVLPETVRRHPVFWGLGLVLVLALAGTWAAKTHALQDVRGDLSERRAVVSERALQAIAEEFATLQSELRTQAQSLAEDTMVVRGLRQWSAGEERPRMLIRHLSDLRVGDRTAVEVYAPTPRLLAWTGVRMPLDDAPDGDLFLESPQTAISIDGDVRRGLAVWWPVRENGRSIGVVRVVRVVEYQPPVQNRYIQGYSLESEWAEQTGESVSVAWGAPAAAERDGSLPDTTAAPEPHVDLTSPAGTLLGRVTVSRPPPERLVQMTEARYDDLLALWATLGLLWAAVGAWGGYVRLARREGLGASMEALKGAALRFLGVTVVWWAARYALIALDVPGRWQADGAALDPLFDPSYLASTFGFGLMRSTGDLLLTGTFGVLYAVGFLHLASNFRLSAPSLPQLAERIQEAAPSRPSSARFLATIFVTVSSLLASVFILSTYVRRAVLDSTLDFFSRTGLLPQPLVLVVLCALFLLVVGTVLIGIGVLWVALRLLVRYRPRWWSRGIPILSVAVVVALVVGAVYLGTSAWEAVPLPVALGFLGILGGAAAWGLVWPHEGFGQLTLRGLLPSVLALTVLLYPMLYEGMDTQRREHMVEAAASFEAGRDPRALFSIEQVLRTAQRDLGPLLQAGARGEDVAVDSVATRLVRRSLLASLTSYEASFTLFTGQGTPLYRYTAAGLQTRRTRPEPSDRAAFEILQGVYRIQGGTAPLVEQIRSDRLNDRRSAAPFQYAGLIALSDTVAFRPPGAEPGGGEAEPDGQRYWGLLRAEPRSLLPGTGGGVPRVLLPDGSYSDLYAELSLAEFREGTLTRSLGREFGRAQLPADLRETIETNGTLWRSETVRDRQYLTYYRAHRIEAADETAIIAVRIPSVLAFDHLYYLLRLTVAGLCVGLIVYLLGVAVRYRRGLLPAPRVRFRDKVLNAFLVVGVVSMIAVGVVGVQVVTGENERVIERRLQDDLSRVEETLALQAERGERTYEVAQRIDVDALSARVGLDVHVYRDGSLVSTSRPRLVRDRLVDERLPSDVYYALYGEAYRFTSAPSSIGGFEYRVGYQALADEAGTPQVVVAVPTLAQQERIEEEQARTLAYLFGALLLLVVVVMLTALLLANALARPIAQLREGLEAVGEGRFTRVLPVDTRDEIGDLVQTFNEMREQLAESRRKLAQQERELAWREMARQVAHEIKNPLTPMKLSIQHLRRAFQREETRSGDEEAPSDKFAGLFDRITSTLIEQIEALARIANEFSTFARLPTRVMETLDLNEVLREAVDLMQEDTDDATLELDLHPEPLVVEADREELRRIYINLIKNALQAIPEHREGRIEITTDRVEPSGDAAPGVRSTIRDNGTGIPDDLRDKIFQPNFSTKTSGTGLGLAIARKGVEELDGQIGFETTEGEGTTFWIRLPLSEEATVEVEQPDEG